MMDADRQCVASAHDRILGKLYVLTVALLVFTGFGQMPIFKRYYLADVPGLGWTSDFFVTHALHYIGATVLLGLLGYVVSNYWFSRRKDCKLTVYALVRVVLLGGLIATGILRVLKNSPALTFSPDLVLFADLSHLGLTMLFGVTALVLFVLKKGWLEIRG